MRYTVSILLAAVILGSCSPDHSSSPHKGSRMNVMEQGSPKKQALKNSVKLDVPLVKQNPELKYGCEITSLAMVLQYAGIHVDKMTLSRQIKIENDPLITSKSGNILRWGDPEKGFVGDMTGVSKRGYAVYDKPIVDLMERYLPGRTVNLTKNDFSSILFHLSNGSPVITWTTGDYRVPDRPESWKHGNKIIHTPMDLHAVVVCGYDSQYLYLNDPLSGQKSLSVPKSVFIQSWKALGCRAVSYQ
ncbi:C39 family peptidase [Peribacillus kribbensis]|uniref:C39 family peptidase n=1 Tax=Peribacillus kribbensis TaxID=356658 RepID=UPI00040160FA|nr:C39 family peptidase [Peribacillus kribbensis]